MKTDTSLTSNIAWFKLADFVARGEKERALSVMRLFMHSVSNEALTHQLEGDILLAFNDNAAQDRYYNAANLFKKSGNLHQAASAYQQALYFNDDENILQLLLETYALLKMKTGLINTFSKFAKIMLQKNNFEMLNSTFDQTLHILDHCLQASLSAEFCITILLHDKNNSNLARLIEQTIQHFQSHPNPKLIASDMQKFLTKLKALNYQIYKKIESELKDYHE